MIKDNKSSKRIMELTEHMEPRPHQDILNEGGAPKNSIYGSIGIAAMPHLLKALKKHVPSKYVKFSGVKGAGLGLWLIELKGYTRSDLSINGWVTMTAAGGSIKSWSVDLDFVDAMKGRVQQSWELPMHESWDEPFANCAKTLKQWVEL